MTKTIIITAIIILIIYYYYQKQEQTKPAFSSSDPDYQQSISETVAELKLDKEVMQTERDDLKLKNAELLAQLASKETELSLILNEWKWGSWKPASAIEFIDKFKPWIEKRLDQEAEVKKFLKNHQAKDLREVSEKYDELIEISREKVRMENEFEEMKKELETSKVLGQELRKELESLKEESEELSNLEAERDEAIRDKQTTEQDNISLTNRLKLKVQEVSEKEKQITLLKKEASEKDKALNDKIKELKKEIKELRKADEKS